MSLALALDLGTTSLSAVAVDAEGRVAAKVTAPNTAAVKGLPVGHAEQSPGVLRAAACSVLRALAERLPGEPLCLGMTGQMHGTLLVDVDRRPITNLITWQDRRANEPASAGGETWLERCLARAPEEALHASGCRLSAGYLGVTLFVLAQQERLPANAHRAAFLADWIAAELADVPVVTDRSNAGASGIYDFVRGRWSEELIAAGGLAPSLFPEVRESGARLGGLSKSASVETGLPAGLPVCNAIGDNQAAVLGSVPAGEPTIQINVGTGGQINWPVDRFLRVEGMDTRYLPHGRFMLVGAGLAGGDAYAWLNQAASAWLADLGLELPRDEVYKRMNAAAGRIAEGADGLRCEPQFRGTRHRPLARGTMSGIAVDNFTLGHVARAVLEGIGAGMRSFYDGAGAARPKELGRIVGSGNGLRRNPLLVEVLSRTFASGVRLTEHEEEAAFGAALLAGTACGLWPDLEAAGRSIRYQPHPT